MRATKALLAWGLAMITTPATLAGGEAWVDLRADLGYYRVQATLRASDTTGATTATDSGAAST